MEFFKNKNPNESAYVGGKKHITDVIKNTASGNFLIWKQPEEDFNTNSTLIVMPGEDAIFVDGGNIAQVFSSGTYTLSTNNYPFISRLRNSLSGGISKFNCVVYYVNKSTTMEIYWGTDSPVQVRDPVFQIACDVQARGSYKIMIEDSAKFLTQLLGSRVNFADPSILKSYFRSEFLMHIKTNLAQAIKNNGEELIGINSHQQPIAKELSEKVAAIFSEYGIGLQSFSIESIDVVDNENRKKLEDAIATKGVFGILGDNWDKQRQFELMKDVVNNQSNGMANAFAGAGAGFGMGMGMGNAFGSMANGMFNNNNQGGFADGAATENPLDKLNPQPQPQAPQQAVDDPVNALKKLKEMLDQGLIPQEVYNAKMSEIISRM